jgi:hypothetical protein
MDPKDDKKKIKKDKADKKGTKTRQKKSKKSKKSKKDIKSFVQQTPIGKDIPSGSGSLTSGARDILGSGGIPGLLQALGVKGRFQQMGGSTGFGMPIQAPIQAAAPPQVAAPIQPPTRFVQPKETIMKEEQNLRKLQRAFRNLTKQELMSRINQYFGDEDLDYIVKDEILSARTKNGMLERMANMVDRYNNIDISQFIDFIPSEDVEEEESMPISVDMVGGDNMSVLSSPGFSDTSSYNASMNDSLSSPGFNDLSSSVYDQEED